MQAARQVALSGARSALGAPTAAAWWPAAVAAAGLHTARQLLSSLQVKIPALGESIADGTVAVVLKQPGDRVEEDEPILQASFCCCVAVLGQTLCRLSCGASGGCCWHWH